MRHSAKGVRVFDVTIKWAAAVAGIILMFSMISICINVLLRYALNISLEWVVEISEYSLLYIAFLAAAWVHMQNRHVNIDLIVNLLGPKARGILDITNSIITSIVCLLLVFFSVRITWFYFLTHSRYESTLGLPRAAISIIIPIGSFLFFLESLIKLREIMPPDKQRANGNKNI